MELGIMPHSQLTLFFKFLKVTLVWRAMCDYLLRGGYPTKPVRKGSNQVLYGILEAKGPIQSISYLLGLKGRSFL